MKDLIMYLVTLREKYNLFTKERCAADLDVSYQTIYNFEIGNSENARVLVYYISKALWALEDSYFYSDIANCDEEEVMSDRQNIVTMLMITKFN